jgi:hypothetical protein
MSFFHKAFFPYKDIDSLAFPPMLASPESIPSLQKHRCGATKKGISLIALHITKKQ